MNLQLLSRALTLQWYDPSYWLDGLVLRFSLDRQIRASATNIQFYYDVFLGKLIFGYFVLLVCGWSVKTFVKGIDSKLEVTCSRSSRVGYLLYRNHPVLFTMAASHEVCCSVHRSGVCRSIFKFASRRFPGLQKIGSGDDDRHSILWSAVSSRSMPCRSPACGELRPIFIGRSPRD